MRTPTADRAAPADPADLAGPANVPDLSVVGDADLADQVCSWAGRVAVADAEFLRLLGELDAREAWSGVGIRSCAHWLSWRCGMSLTTARDKVRTARRLRGLPQTATALAEARLSYSKVRALVRVATPGTEADLISMACSATASQVERFTRALPTVLPDDVPAGADRDRRHELRLQWRTDEETGRVRFNGVLEAADAALVLAVLRQVGEARRVEGPGPQPPDRPDDDPSAESEPDELPAVVGAPTCRSGSFAAAVVADAFRAAAAGLAAHEEDADTDGASVLTPTAEVVIHAESTLLTGAHVDNGGPVSREVLEQLACEGGIRLDVHGPDGATLDVGRRTRRPNTRQLKVLVRRDGGCTVPGCGRNRFLHAHHVVFWSRGGRTAVDNMLLLCGEHHRALHLGVFAIELLGGQRFRFRDPDGTVIDYAPPVPAAGALAVDDTRYTLIDGNSLTPEWYGEPLTLDGIEIIADHYHRNRDAERCFAASRGVSAETHSRTGHGPQLVSANSTDTVPSPTAR